MVKLQTNATTVAQTSDIASRLVTIHRNCSLENSSLSAMFSELDDVNERTRLLLLSERTRSNLLALDKQRCKIWRQLTRLLHGYTFSTNREIQESAMLLRTITTQVSTSVLNRGYSVKSAYFASALVQLTSETIQGFVRRLDSVDELIRNLGEAQNQFHQKHVAYNEIVATESQQPSKSELKKKMCRIINQQIVGYLNAMRFSADPELKRLYSTVEEVITTHNAIVKRHPKGKKESPSSVDTLLEGVA